MRLSRISILTFVLLLPACSRSNTPSAPPPPDPTDGLKELGEVYRYRAAEQLPAPTKLADLGDQRAALENAWPLIESGEIVVVWKVGYSASSADVLAHAKDASASGGKVLLRNGTVKEMSPTEFKVAKRN